MTKQATNEKKERELSPITITIVVMLALIIAYFLLIQAWQNTSQEYLPTDNLDSQVKTPAEKQDWFERRQRGL